LNPPTGTQRSKAAQRSQACDWIALNEAITGVPDSGLWEPRNSQSRDAIATNNRLLAGCFGMPLYCVPMFSLSSFRTRISETADACDVGETAVLKLDDLVQATIQKPFALHAGSNHAAPRGSCRARHLTDRPAGDPKFAGQGCNRAHGSNRVSQTSIHGQ
jgi:hypothetical protein